MNTKYLTSKMSKLIQFLSPWVNQFELPKQHLPVYPYYQSVSRLKYKPDVFDHALICNPIDTLLSMENPNKTFEQICLERAEYLKTLNGNLYVLWSGGIDSTTALSAIFKTFSKEDLSRVYVLCNDRSIDENPNYFRLIIRNKIKTLPSTLHFEKHIQDGWVVTGELGDQVFGQDMIGSIVRQSGDNAIHEPWQNHIPAFFEAMSEGGSLYVNELLSPIQDEAPFKLTSVHDFAWWWNFTQKWQHVKLRWLTSDTWNNPKEEYQRMIHFYDTTDFELWSIHNHDKKIGKTWNSYKQISKEFSIDWSKDDNFINKKKEVSAPYLFAGHPANWAIDEHWNFLTKEEALKRIL